MSKLSQAEQAFLNARLTEQKALREKRNAAMKELEPVVVEYNTLQAAIDGAVEAQATVGARKREIKEKHDLANVENELSEVAKDVTRLLRKQRKLEKAEKNA